MLKMQNYNLIQNYFMILYLKKIINKTLFEIEKLFFLRKNNIKKIYIFLYQVYLGQEQQVY